MSKKITKTQIDKLAINQKLCGEGMEIRRSKKGLTFYAATQVNGVRLREVIGYEKDGMNLTRARQKLAALSSDTYRNHSQKVQNPKIKFNDASAYYLQVLHDTGGKNIKQKTQQIKMHLNAFFGKTQIKKIKKLDVDKYIKTRRDAGASVSTINRELATVRHMFNQISDWGVVTTSHLSIKNISGENRKDKTFTNTQVKEMLCHAKSDSDPYTYFFILIGFQTSMRHSEILKIKFEDFDHDNKKLTLSDAKAGRRQVPIHDSLLEIIREEQQNRGVKSGFLFASHSKTGHRSYMNNQFNRVLEAAGLQDSGLTPHSMRHTAISTIMRTKISISDAMVISGHKSASMLLHYTHHNSEGVSLGVSTLAGLTSEPSSTLNETCSNDS